MMQILDTVDRLTEPALPDGPPRLLGVVKDLIPTTSATASYRPHVDAVVKSLAHVVDRLQIAVTSAECTDVGRQLLSR